VALIVVIAVSFRRAAQLGDLEWRQRDYVAEDVALAALAFGATVHALRLQAGISLNELARRAGVDPAYVHRMEARGAHRPPLPRRPVVLALAAAFGSDARQADQLLALAGHAPAALLELGGWDQTLASVAELLADPSRAAQLGRAGRQRSLEFSARAVVPRIESAYREVIDGVVHLGGTVTDIDDGENAEAVAAAVPGVTEVVDETEIAG